MYENITYEIILKRMMEHVPNNLDKREGSVIYNALAPAAVELQNMYIQLDWMLDQSFADTQGREYLIRRCAERGVVPEEATKALLRGYFNMALPIGSRFSLGMLNYIVVEEHDPSKFIYILECEEAGEEGNKHFGNLIPVEYLKGLTTAWLSDVLIPGEEAEDTEHLRKRFYDSLNAQAFGGNIADYKVKTNALNGVGGTKVYPTPDGKGGTVKLVIIDSMYRQPSKELIFQVQEAIDPVGSQGKGLGLAPIGHLVEVTGVRENYIDINTRITYQNGWKWKDIEPYVITMIDDYFKELRSSWQEADHLIIRVSQIEARLLNITGIVDITDTIINKEANNLELETDEIPVRGSIYG